MSMRSAKLSISQELFNELLGLENLDAVILEMKVDHIARSFEVVYYGADTRLPDSLDFPSSYLEVKTTVREDGQKIHQSFFRERIKSHGKT